MAMTQSLGGGLGSASGYALKSDYADAPEVSVEMNGLMRLADGLAGAAARIDNIASQLNNLSLGIHGPRPEPVNAAAGVAAPKADSLAARVSSLLEAVDRLERSYGSVVR